MMNEIGEIKCPGCHTRHDVTPAYLLEQRRQKPYLLFYCDTCRVEYPVEEVLTYNRVIEED